MFEAKCVIKICMNDKVLEGAMRLLDNAEVIKQAVDLRGTCIALDDCYEVRVTHHSLSHINVTHMVHVPQTAHDALVELHGFRALHHHKPFSSMQKLRTYLHPAAVWDVRGLVAVGCVGLGVWVYLHPVQL